MNLKRTGQALRVADLRVPRALRGPGEEAPRGARRGQALGGLRAGAREGASETVM